MKEIRSFIRENGVLLFDGGMGTFYASRNRTSHRDCEWANLSAPGEIEAIHRAYLEVGCRAIKTNTYGANRQNFPQQDCAAIIREGWLIARRAAGNEAYVFADVGPIDARDDTDLLEEYHFIVDQFLSLGARHFLFETIGTDLYLHEIAAHIKAADPEAFVLVSFAAQPDGFTRDGRLIGELCRAAAADAYIDAVGLNCVSGGRQMVDLMGKIGPIEGLFSVMPNAGYPTVRGNRTYYDGEPGYFASQIAIMHARGAAIIGGCCGTTPEHIDAAAKAIRAPAPALIDYPARKREREAAALRHDPFWDALCDSERRPFAVELDPPEGADVAGFMEGARRLRDGGADMITVADCPIARARMDSSLMVCKIKRELGMPVMPHLTCRDRNLNATQALLLGLCAEDVGNVLLVTGDPVPAASRDEVKSVYNFNSRKLIKFVDSMNKAVLPAPFHIFAALNVNARNFAIQLDLARQKEENGADGFLTQPVFTDEALENLRLARRTLKGKRHPRGREDHRALRERRPRQGRRARRRDLREHGPPHGALRGRLLPDHALFPHGADGAHHGADPQRRARMIRGQGKPPAFRTGKRAVSAFLFIFPSPGSCGTASRRARGRCRPWRAAPRACRSRRSRRP